VRSDPRLNRLWAAAECMRAVARGGPESFRQSVSEYEGLLSAIDATREYPVRVVAREAGVTASMVRRLRGEALARKPSGS